MVGGTRGLPFALALGVLLAVPHGASADYKDTYKQGVEAVEKSRWPDAARLMQAAIAGKSVEGETIRFYGQRFEPYLPHYYLGLALFNSGDCVGALRSWAVSESQGAVRKTEHYRTLTRNRSACEAKAPPPRPATPAPPPGPDPAALAQAVQAAEAALKRADDASRSTATAQADALLSPIWSQDATLGPTQERGRETLSSARGKLEAARRKPDLAQLQDARETAERAAQQLEAVTAQAGRRRAELAAAARPTPAPPAPAIPTPTPAAARTAPSPELLAGARAFFGAQYQQAVALLAQADGFPGRAGAHALVLRAASRHALYLLGGERDSGLLARAEADARAARRVDPRVVPDPQAFSPRFVEFFRRVR
jgi:hypothetical protein